MKKNKAAKILLVLSVLSFIGLTISYFFLPEKIPVHWNINNKVDSYGPKELIFLFGGIPFFIKILFKLPPVLDPKRRNYQKHRKAYAAAEIYITLFMIVVCWLIVGASFGMELNIGRIISCLIGILFLIIGNYLPTLKPNYFFGIRNPWTLDNEIVWKKTHKTGGYLFAAMGILFIVSGFINTAAMQITAIIVLLVGIAGINIYSFLLFKRI